MVNTEKQPLSQCLAFLETPHVVLHLKTVSIRQGIFWSTTHLKYLAVKDFDQHNISSCFISRISDLL